VKVGDFKNEVLRLYNFVTRLNDVSDYFFWSNENAFKAITLIAFVQGNEIKTMMQLISATLGRDDEECEYTKTSNHLVTMSRLKKLAILYCIRSEAAKTLYSQKRRRTALTDSKAPSNASTSPEVPKDPSRPLGASLNPPARSRSRLATNGGSRAGLTPTGPSVAPTADEVPTANYANPTRLGNR